MQQPNLNPIAQHKRPDTATRVDEFRLLVEAELLAREQQRESPPDRGCSHWSRFLDRGHRIFATT